MATGGGAPCALALRLVAVYRKVCVHLDTLHAMLLLLLRRLLLLLLLRVRAVVLVHTFQVDGQHVALGKRGLLLQTHLVVQALCKGKK